MTPEERAPRALVGQARDLRAGLATVTAAPLATRGVARSAYEAARDELVYQQLSHGQNHHLGERRAANVDEPVALAGGVTPNG